MWFTRVEQETSSRWDGENPGTTCRTQQKPQDSTQEPEAVRSLHQKFKQSASNMQPIRQIPYPTKTKIFWFFNHRRHNWQKKWPHFLQPLQSLSMFSNHLTLSVSTEMRKEKRKKPDAGSFSAASSSFTRFERYRLGVSSTPSNTVTWWRNFQEA